MKLLQDRSNHIKNECDKQSRIAVFIAFLYIWYDIRYRTWYVLQLRCDVRSNESIETSAVSSLKRTKKKIYEYAFENHWSGIVKNGKEIFNINKRSFKYGFTTATKIKSTEKVSNYITKYITKELITMSKGQHRYLYSKNLAKPQSETLFEEDLKFMELFLSKHKDLVKIKKVKDEESGIETTYITIKKTE